ncbi:MAG: GH3 auxin-responsive promoter family protein [Lewinella sp.]|nr:GH3 auxin-responsive promoter family protein [Lewinella sp.]
MPKPKVPRKILKNSASLVKALKQNQTPAQQQARTLRQLLRRAEFTAFGNYYDFGGLLKADDPVNAFQQLVPIVDYDQMYDAWWHRTIAGAPDITWRGKVKYFALSSGTAGATSKYIPVTNDMTRAMRAAALRMFACLPKYHLPAGLYTKDWLMIGGSASLSPMDSGAMSGDLSGINARKPPVWIRGYYKPGTRIARLKSWDERVTAISELAPKWDVGIIAGIPSWVQLTLERIIADHGLNNIHELWPNLQVFVSGGIAFEPYRRSFEQLLDHPIIYQDSYLASEGFIAFQSRPGTQAMRLVLNNGIFYEFVPFDDAHFDEEGLPRPGAKALTMDEVTTGVDYALLISTCAGAWRYLIGDTVRFTDTERAEVIITGRTKHFLSICGEHLSVDNMNKAIQIVEEKLGMAIPEFTVGGVKSGSHFAHHWYLGSDGQHPADGQMALALDEALKIVNDDYGAERSAMLQPPIVQVVPVRRFYDWQRERGKLNGQSKIPRVMRGSQLAEWETFVAGEKTA